MTSQLARALNMYHLPSETLTFGKIFKLSLSYTMSDYGIYQIPMHAFFLLEENWAKNCLQGEIGYKSKITFATFVCAKPKCIVEKLMSSTVR